MKKTILVALLSISVVAFGTSCKKGGDNSSTSTSSAPPVVALTGTPAQQMIQVMEMGVNALKSNPDASVAASALKAILNNYNVESLRAASKAAKDAGQGATAEELNRFKALQEEYKSLAQSVGSQNPGAFNEVHTEWSKAWGIN
ncbi:MAG: hypothetical protein H3C43_04280 [Leptonema sp. (in: Bacteria)]|nr:hypothetical protein [Leptonema sp. (in: bacteria)]